MRTRTAGTPCTPIGTRDRVVEHVCECVSINAHAEWPRLGRAAARSEAALRGCAQSSGEDDAAATAAVVGDANMVSRLTASQSELPHASSTTRPP
jgi:hypothetical protein